MFSPQPCAEGSERKNEMGAIEKSKKNILNYFKEFKEGYLEGTAGFMKAGKAYVAALDDNPINRQLFRDEFPGFTEAIWRQYEEIGRGLMYFGTVTAGLHKNKIRKLV